MFHPTSGFAPDFRVALALAVLLGTGISRLLVPEYEQAGSRVGLARVPRRLAWLGVLNECAACRKGRLSRREEQRCGVQIGAGQKTFWRSRARLYDLFRQIKCWGHLWHLLCMPLWAAAERPSRMLERGWAAAQHLDSFQLEVSGLRRWQAPDFSHFYCLRFAVF